MPWWLNLFLYTVSKKLMPTTFSNKKPFLPSSLSIILLAAGASTRLGQPKQLLEVHEKPLIEHTLEQALALKAHSLITVLGANANRIKEEIAHLPIELVLNPNWDTGIASSITIGIQTLEKIHPTAEAVLILLCDQPYISATLIQKLASHFHENEKLIVASEYGNTFGVPAIFDKSLFDALKNIKGDKGAKSIIKKYFKETCFIPFPEGEFDIDTKEDYENWQNEGKNHK